MAIRRYNYHNENQIEVQGVVVKQITRINHVGLRVRDLALARAFYEKLGFEFLGGPMFHDRDPDGNVIEFHKPAS